jgi:hypothetical protein
MSIASVVTRRGWASTVAGSVLLLVSAVPAVASPVNGYAQDPVQPCGASTLSPGAGIAATSAFIPVAGDATAYQKCGPAGTPLGIKHCPDGFVFDASTSYCIPKQATDATLSVDSVWKGTGADGQPCVSVCQPKPINVKLTYSASSAGSVSVTLADPTGAKVWGGSANMLTGDGQTHSVVVATNSLNPQSGDWSPKSGDPVLVQAYLTSGKSNPDGDPLIVTATTAQSVTATTAPTAQ